MCMSIDLEAPHDFVLTFFTVSNIGIFTIKCDAQDQWTWLKFLGIHFQLT